MTQVYTINSEKKGKEWRSILPELPKFAPFLLLMPQLL